MLRWEKSGERQSRYIIGRYDRAIDRIHGMTKQDIAYRDAMMHRSTGWIWSVYGGFGVLFIVLGLDYS